MAARNGAINNANWLHIDEWALGGLEPNPGTLKKLEITWHRSIISFKKQMP
jgi:hypothetical protein